jgi:hypothetical protein
LESLLEAGQTSGSTKACLGTEVAEAAADLLNNKHEAIGIAVEADPNELLNITA